MTNFYQTTTHLCIYFMTFRAILASSLKFVYVANESGSISIFALNRDGTLSSAGTVETPSGAFAITVVQARQ